MLLDGRTLGDGADLTADVCVVGAGPAGLATALELADAGLDVCVLESGGVEAGGDAQSLADGASVGHSYFPLSSTRLRAVGGTSNHWYELEGFRARPLDPIDFERREGIPHTGWPFDRRHLDPWYERAQDVLGLGPYAYELEDWRGRGGGEVLDLDERVVRTVIFQVVPGGNLAERHRARLDDHPRLRLVTHATVLELQTDGGRLVRRLRVATGDGRRRVVRARAYVLAAGGIENARLLLLSRDRDPAGLGNDHDLVGRFFMEHLGVRVGTLTPAQAGFLRRTGFYREADVGGFAIQGKLSLAPEVLRRERLLNATFFLEHMGASRATPGVRSFVVLRRALRWRPRPPRLATYAGAMLRGLPHVADTVVREATPYGRRLPPQVIQLKAMTEQAPNPQSRVTLDPSTDALGQPRVRLDWRPTAFDVESIRRSEEIIDGQLRAAGLGQLRDRLDEQRPPAHLSGQWHHLGTTRMHDDPRQGVVDADGRLHTADNLYVTGGSVFPTGGYANPTLTVVALALRLADHLRDRAADLPMPEEATGAERATS